MSVLGSTFRLIWSLANTWWQIATSMSNAKYLGQGSDSFDLSPILDDKLQLQCPMSMLWFHVEYKDDKKKSHSDNKMLRVSNCRVMPQDSNVIHHRQKLHMECLALWGFKCSAGTRESWTKDWQGGWHCKINSGIQKKSFQDNWVTSKKKKNFLDLNQPWETNYSD